MTPFLLHVKRKTCKQIVSIRSVYALLQFPARHNRGSKDVSRRPRLPLLSLPSLPVVIRVFAPHPLCPVALTTDRHLGFLGDGAVSCLDAVTVAQSVRCDLKAKPGDVSGPTSQDTSSFVWVWI